jgi:ankyrin repeat protein
MGAVVGPAVSSKTGERWPVYIDGEPADAEPVLLKQDNLEVVPYEALDVLLKAGVDVNQGSQTHYSGRGLLHCAAADGDVELARRVLATKRASIEARDKSGFTPLHLAARGRRGEVVRCLVEAKANTSIETSNGKTALELARTNGGDASILKLLGDSTASYPAASEAKEVVPQRLEDLSAEQRAALFID